MMTFHPSTADDGHSDVAAVSSMPLDKSTSRLSDSGSRRPGGHRQLVASGQLNLGDRQMD